jgi:hypothetical protein
MMDIDIPEAIDCINQFSMLEMIYLMERCQLLVALRLGPVALAGLTSIAICGLYSIIPANTDCLTGMESMDGMLWVLIRDASMVNADT